MGRKERYIAFRESEAVVSLIDKVVTERGIDRSDFIREAIRKRLAELSFFSSEAKKALGVPLGQPQTAELNYQESRKATESARKRTSSNASGLSGHEWRRRIVKNK
jgi:Arc/MetJ-type ribon-helix-helix transcriptional regulator